MDEGLEHVDAATLPARIEAARAEAARARDAAATARARLALDEATRAERTRLAAEVERARAEGEVWRSLSSLIGSADGSRFRQFAQGLTLDALVAHANEHLQVLAPRYRLRRTKSEQQKHDLDLVVIDTEGGGDVRSTQTLSGGESFLVSLALALGLSSLSANEGARGRVESLFIDEGFSALDQETLDVALSAFDALRQTGRQIGVISHVPLLVERLGAQVRVVPIGGGASRVEIHAA
jgi:exonuclease SbcC